MDEELDLVVFEDDEGNELTMQVLDYFYYEGEEYALLTDVDDDACDYCEDEECDCCDQQRDAYIMKVVPVGEDQEEFIPVSEELADKLIEIIENDLYDDPEEE